MSQPNVKELETLVKMLRKHGVTSFEGHGLKLLIDPPELRTAQPSNDKIDDLSPFAGLTDEQILMYSVRDQDGN
jgi:hypothetical protein